MEKKIIYLEDRRDFHNRIESEKTANCLVANELSSVDNALSMMEQCLGHNGFILRHIDMTAVIEAMMRPIWDKYVDEKTGKIRSEYVDDILDHYIENYQYKYSEETNIFDVLRRKAESDDDDDE